MDRQVTSNGRGSGGECPEPDQGAPHHRGVREKLPNLYAGESEGDGIGTQEEVGGGVPRPRRLPSPSCPSSTSGPGSVKGVTDTLELTERSGQDARRICPLFLNPGQTECPTRLLSYFISYPFPNPVSFPRFPVDKRDLRDWWVPEPGHPGDVTRPRARSPKVLLVRHRVLPTRTPLESIPQGLGTRPGSRVLSG